MPQIFSKFLKKRYTEGLQANIGSPFHSKSPISAHWRTSAPSIYGKYDKAKKCPKGFAISGFRTRALAGLGSIRIRGTHVGFDGALTGVEFACSNVKDAKTSNSHRMPSDTLSFTLKVKRRSEFHFPMKPAQEGM